MTFPVVWDLGGVSVRAHTVFEVLGYAAAFRLHRALLGRTGDVVDVWTRWAGIAAAIVGAALGSRLLFVLDDPGLIPARSGDPVALFGGKTIVGALLGGWLAVEVVKRRMGTTRRTGDAYAAALLLGIGVGRIGCFLEGVNDATHGLPTALPVGVDFGDGVPRHATQLYESLLALAALPFAVRATLRRPAWCREGDLFRIVLGGYLLWRFGIDFLKPGSTWWAGLSGIQVAAGAGAAVLLASVFRGRGAVGSPP